MIVTLVANTTKYASGLRGAAKSTQSFGDFAAKAFKLTAASVVGVGVALANVIPALANMGAESRRADIQLRFMLENMQGIGTATNATVARLSKYATTVQKATGIDDEQVKAVQKKILVFKSLRATAGRLGGTFDRATKAAIDLAAAGFGDMEANAIKLGRVLDNPTKNLNALSRAGITFTDAEKKKIVALTKSGDLLKAQDIILKSIEGRVSGIAEKAATPFDKLNGQFQEMGDTIGMAMLPALDDLNKKLGAWLSSKKGKEDLQQIVDAFVSMARAINTVVGAILDLRDAWRQATEQAQNYNSRFSFPGAPSAPAMTSTTGPTTPADRVGASRVTVNVTGITPTATVGRTVIDAVNTANRYGVR
jgi:hypothetical protein